MGVINPALSAAVEYFVTHLLDTSPRGPDRKALMFSPYLQCSLYLIN
jgi:hypothetical protein